MNILKDLNVIHRLSISRSEKKIPDQSAARSFFPAEPVRSDESIFFFGSDYIKKGKANYNELVYRI